MNRYLLPSGLVLLFAVSLSLGAYNNDSNTDISPNARTVSTILFLDFYLNADAFFTLSKY